MSVTGLSARRFPGTGVSVAPRHALMAAVVPVLLLFAGWLLAFHDSTVANADANAYYAFIGLGQSDAALHDLAVGITRLCLSGSYVVLAVVPVLIALARRRWALAVAIAVMIPAAIGTSELLKTLLAAPRPIVGVPRPAVSLGSWPSGHATASMVLALGLIIASPTRWRPWAALIGTVFALAVTYSVLTLGWHYPSDALGGLLVALTWTLLAVAAVLAADARFGRDLGQLSIERGQLDSYMPSLWGILAAAAVPFLVVVLWRGPEVFSRLTDHPAFIAAAAAVGVTGVLVPTALSLMLSGSGPAARAARRPRSQPG